MNLNEKLAYELRELHQRWSDKGDLPSRTQLADYYRTFRDRFGPERLQRIDGLALLELMHEHGNRDSLVYWLEFKDDEEFPARFGSIAGGSALKFGIYRRRETGAWMIGSPQHQQEIGNDEAVQIARRNRDQLCQGAEYLSRMTGDSDDNTYEWLQEILSLDAPNVGDTAWGHKYFSLLAPDQIDSFHNPNYQRFHLIKLLQQPPAGNGRYRAAGRYAEIARYLDMPLNHLTSLLKERNSRPYRYWRLDISGRPDGGYFDDQSVAIGWSRLGDLSELGYNKQSREQIRAKLWEHYPASTQEVGLATRQVFDFVADMGSGDLVLVSNDAEALGIARVIGGYHYVPDILYPHRRTIKWLTSEAWELPLPEGLHTIFTELRNDSHLLTIERHLLNPRPGPPPSGDKDRPIPPEPSPPRRPGLPLLRRLDGRPGQIQGVLERKGQVILYGPPGTGKTHWAELAARNLAAYARFDTAFTSLTPAQQQEITGGGEQRGQVRLCSFHPAYGYEDFLEGYRPHAQGDQMVFTVRDGIFKQLCQDAQAEPDQPYILIIDEINRGDIPRIFGELLTVLEKSKRGRPIILPLTGTSFAVPENVFVIGTMNTADRSIALLDTALRRRFGFIELMPDSAVLDDTTIAGIPLGPWLDALNRRIREEIGRDARNLQIGHSYLLDNGRPVAEFTHFARIVREDIIPLIEEYCYEEYNALERILGKGLLDTKRQQIRYELFDPDRQAELIQALLALDPQIATSYQAIISSNKASDEQGDDLLDASEESSV